MSRIGKKPVELPKGVTASLSGQTVEVKGPKGTRQFTATDDVNISIDGDKVKVDPRGTSKRARAQWGMSRTMVANLVKGVTEGFKKELEINGVGYRAEVRGTQINFTLGYSHPIVYQLPTGVTAKVERQVLITLEGADLQLLGTVAAQIRELRRPEPYKGKGIKYAGETIRRKAGKAAAGASAS